VPTPPLAQQVSPPILALTTAATGDHVLTLSVTPDNLGPVTVRAHMGADGLRVELFAPNDAGRDALRAVMTDLRRDLAGTGVNTTLQLSSNNQPGSNSGGFGTGFGTGQGDASGSQSDARSNGPTQANPVRAETPSAASQSRPTRSDQHASSIDVMA
jgi:hypothetical protein